MKKENDIFKQKNRLVGGIVPQPLADKLSLYCLCNAQTRSKLIASLLEKQLSQYNEKEMIEEIGERLSQKIEGFVTSQKVAFLFEVRYALERKKIAVKHIDQIISKMRHFYAKNKDQEVK